MLGRWKSNAYSLYIQTLPQEITNLSKVLHKKNNTHLIMYIAYKLTVYAYQNHTIQNCTI